MHESKVDLSALDPARDPERWNRRVESVAARAVAGRRPLTVATLVLNWSRPALALAACMALVSWLGYSSRRGESGAATQVQDEAPWILTHWATSDDTPSVASMLEVLGAGAQ